LQQAEIIHVMNQILKISLSLLFASVFLMGCEDDDDFTTIDLNTSIKHSVDIIIPDSNETTHEQTLVIDPLGNAELEKYRDQLEALSIDKVSFKILNFQGSSKAEFQGYIHFIGSSFTLDLPRTGLRETADNEVVTTLQVSDEILEELTAVFNNLESVVTTTSGTVYNGPASFELEISIGVKAEVKIVP
jgi:hypothetical protein